MILLILETLNQKLISRKAEHREVERSCCRLSFLELLLQAWAQYRENSKNIKVMNKITLILLDNNIFWWSVILSFLIFFIRQILW